MMSILKFTAKVNQGKIEIPDEYLKDLEEAQTVEIKINKPAKTAAVGIISELIKNPLDCDNGIPLTREKTHEC